MRTVAHLRPIRYESRKNIKKKKKKKNYFFFFNDTATTEIYTLSLHDALPICIPMRIEQYYVVFDEEFDLTTFDYIQSITRITGFEKRLTSEIGRASCRERV